MIVIAIVDNNLGMMYNRRRQSQDRILREKILDLTTGSKLWMNMYSWGQFSGEKNNEHIKVDPHFLQLAAKGEYCLVENSRIQPYEKEIEKLILFRWNQKYPADSHLDLPFFEWKMVKREEFSGYSHEKIMMEVYMHV